MQPILEKEKSEIKPALLCLKNLILYHILLMVEGLSKYIQ